MSEAPTRDELRLARMLFPGSLLREVDELVLAGRGGYQTRQEFILDAVQNHVLEVKYGEARNGQRPLLSETAEVPPPSGLAQRDPAGGQKSNVEEAPPAPPTAIANGEPIEAIGALTETELHFHQRGAVINDGLAVVKEEPVLGLHNRDYPSIWAAHLLAEETQQRFVPFNAFLEGVTREAWRYGQALRDLEKTSKVKLTALYPTNFAKPQSAEEGFKAFAVGAIAKKPREDGKVDASGPLFSWGVCQVVREDGDLVIGLTARGYELLEGLDRLSLSWPHERHHAECFLAYLRQHAPWDWAGFELLLEVVAEGPTRVELAQRFQQWRPDWSDAMANTNAAGFVARAREWGLMEPKLIDRRYALAEFGEALRAGAVT
jgi:hypothetical protein